MKEFDVKATITIGQKLSKLGNLGKKDHQITFEIKATKPSVEATFTLNARPYNVKFERQADKMTVTIKAASNTVFVGELKKKDNGRVLTITVTGKTLQIFENLSTRTFGDVSTPISIKMTENLQNTKLIFDLDIPAKSFQLEAAKGAEKIKVTGEF